MKQKILDLLDANFSKTHSGMNLIQIVEKLEISQSELKPLLNELYKDKKILIKQGINHRLIFKI